jgi:hypothetical protein
MTDASEPAQPSSSTLVRLHPEPRRLHKAHDRLEGRMPRCADNVGSSPYTTFAGTHDKMARPEGLEPPPYRFEACCSVRLSYERRSTVHPYHQCETASDASRLVRGPKIPTDNTTTAIASATNKNTPGTSNCPSSQAGPSPRGLYPARITNVGGYLTGRPNDKLVLPAPAPTHRLIVVVHLVSSGHRPFMWEVWDTTEMRPLQSSYARFGTVDAAFQAGSDVCLKRWGYVSLPSRTPRSTHSCLHHGESP